jgi:hypothetical protein
MAKLSRVERSVVEGVEHNCRVFLRKAAEEMAGHEDAEDPPFDEARAAIITVMIQTAIELATVALIIRTDGIVGVLRSKASLSQGDLESGWQNGTLGTQAFSQLKVRAAQLVQDEDFWGVVDDFQIARNKLVHFHRPADEASLYDLKFESTFLLLNTVSRLLRNEDYDTPEAISSIVGKQTLARLREFPPYRDRMAALARRHSTRVFTCIICDTPAYAVDELKCMACGWDDDSGLLDCPLCEESGAVFYDALNLPDNDVLRGQCGSCGQRTMVRTCRACSGAYAFVPWAVDCPLCEGVT